MVVRTGGQADHGLLGHALSVDLLSRGRLLRDNLRVALDLRVQTALFLHVPIHICRSLAGLLLRVLIVLLLLLLEVLKSWFDLEAFLKVVEGGVLQPAVAH